MKGKEYLNSPARPTICFARMDTGFDGAHYEASMINLKLLDWLVGFVVNDLASNNDCAFKSDDIFVCAGGSGGVTCHRTGLLRERKYKSVSAPSTQTGLRHRWSLANQILTLDLRIGYRLAFRIPEHEREGPFADLSRSTDATSRF